MLQKLQGHWGFTRLPFGRNLAPSMLHRHNVHNEAVARITWTVNERALGVITGEVGAGKTVAIRAALAGLDEARHKIIYLGNPSVGTRGIHFAIVTALGQAPRFHTAALIPQAADALAAEHDERGRNPVLVIDEAHLLTHGQLEAIRMLTNHEMDLLTALTGRTFQFRGRVRTDGVTVPGHDRTRGVSAGPDQDRGPVGWGAAGDWRPVGALPAA
jgi:Type II secretory pathway, component ExeA (predicted ATPase)